VCRVRRGGLAVARTRRVFPSCAVPSPSPVCRHGDTPVGRHSPDTGRHRRRRGCMDLPLPPPGQRPRITRPFAAAGTGPVGGSVWDASGTECPCVRLVWSPTVVTSVGGRFSAVEEGGRARADVILLMDGSPQDLDWRMSAKVPDCAIPGSETGQVPRTRPPLSLAQPPPSDPA